MNYAADKLVYVDFNDIIFANLYIGRDQSSKASLRQEIGYSYYNEIVAGQLK